MVDETMVCPNCGGNVPNDTTVCPDCHKDLASLVQLEKQHLIRYNAALAAALEGDLKTARRELGVALALKPGFAEALILLAKLYAQQGLWPQAMAAAQEAQAMAPENTVLAGLIAAIDASQTEANSAKVRQQEAARLDRRRQAQRAYGAYERDVAVALGIGVILAALVALLIGGRCRARRRRQAES